MNISDLKPDKRNANKGTERGQYMIDHSIAEYGAGRSILVDKDGNVIAGNKTLQAAVDAGLPIEVVETDGKKLVVVKRNDLDLYSDDQRARLLAYADNRASDVGLAWDVDAILADLSEGLPLDDLFRDGEIASIIGDVDIVVDSWEDALGELPDGDRQPFQQMTFTLHDTQAEQVKQAIAKAKGMSDFSHTENENSNGNAISLICELFNGQS